jgi:FtsP/CotA-like multicopper oxidase with cupredoxin domain
MSPGQRFDVLVKAGAPGTYLLQALDPDTEASVSPSGIYPESRNSRHSFDFPSPCSTLDSLVDLPCPEGLPTYPLPLATIIVDGDPVDMALPSGPLPVPTGLPSVETMLNTTPDAVRNVAFEICGKKAETILQHPENRLPSCGWYFAKYDEKYWGGTAFNNLLMMRDADDTGVPNPSDPNMPRVDFKKEGLFASGQPLFNDMVAGHYEEWTVINRSFSDHPFHIHQNPFLLTKINGYPLSTPEWHDTIIVPGTTWQPTGPLPPPEQPNINNIPHGSITFRIYFKPVTAGCFVMHCHTLTHEDLGMMQRVDILPGPNQPSGCEAETMPQTPH